VERVADGKLGALLGRLDLIEENSMVCQTGCVMQSACLETSACSPIRGELS
jgi:hypothetical protein